MESVLCKRGLDVTQTTSDEFHLAVKHGLDKRHLVVCASEGDRLS